jgi:hypothetical protein
LTSLFATNTVNLFTFCKIGYDILTENILHHLQRPFAPPQPSLSSALLALPLLHLRIPLLPFPRLLPRAELFCSKDLSFAFSPLASPSPSAPFAPPPEKQGRKGYSGLRG